MHPRFVHVCRRHHDMVVRDKLRAVTGVSPLTGEDVGGYLKPRQVKLSLKCQVCSSISYGIYKFGYGITFVEEI